MDSTNDIPEPWASQIAQIRAQQDRVFELSMWPFISLIVGDILLCFYNIYTGYILAAGIVVSMGALLLADHWFNKRVLRLEYDAMTARHQREGDARRQQWNKEHVPQDWNKDRLPTQWQG